MDLDDASRYVGGAVPRYWLVTTPHYHPASVNRRGDGWPKPVSQSRVVLRVVGIEFRFFSSFSSSFFFFFSSSSSPSPFSSPRLLRSLSLVNACINSVQSARARWNRANRDIESWCCCGESARPFLPLFLSFPRLPPAEEGGGRRVGGFSRGEGWWCELVGGGKVEVGRILSRSRRAVKFGLNGHSTRVRGKTWLSLSPGVPSSCAFHPAGVAAAAGGGGGLVGRGEAGTKVLGAEREVEKEEEVENKGSGAEYFNIYHGEIGTRVCRRESLLPRHFPPPPCSSTPRLANRRLRCPTARSDSPLSTPSPSLPLVLVPRDMFIRPADYACYTMVRKNGRKETANFFSFFSPFLLFLTC